MKERLKITVTSSKYDQNEILCSSLGIFILLRGISSGRCISFPPLFPCEYLNRGNKKCSRALKTQSSQVCCLVFLLSCFGTNSECYLKMNFLDSLFFHASDGTGGIRVQLNPWVSQKFPFNGHVHTHREFDSSLKIKVCVQVQ